MQFLTSRDGTKIAFDKLGNGPALVIVLGALANRSMAAKSYLAGLLSKNFTVYAYDRRGRGDSGDTRPYTVDREIEDIEALIDEAGGISYVYGHSSGAALALQATVRIYPKIRKLALYEAPYNDDPLAKARWKAYIAQLTTLLAQGKKGEAVTLFMQYLNTPAEQLERMRQTPFWSALEAAAPTLAYDHTAILGDEAAIPRDIVSSVNIPTLIMAGSLSYPFMLETARTLNTIIPGARLRILEGQTHDVAPEVLAPVLAEFFG